MWGASGRHFLVHLHQYHPANAAEKGLIRSAYRSRGIKRDFGSMGGKVEVKGSKAEEIGIEGG